MYLNDAKKLAEDMLRAHGLSGWSFAFDRAKRRFGSCRFRNKLITLSKTLTSLNDEETVRQTLLHEIAHALAPKGSHHGRRWKELALALGCDARRFYTDEVVTPPAPFTATCPACGYVVMAHRRRRVACKKCCNEHNKGCFDKRFEFVWERSTVDPTGKGCDL